MCVHQTRHSVALKRCFIVRFTARACKLYADVQNDIMQRVCRPPTIVFNLIKPFCFTRACFNLCRGADARSAVPAVVY